MTRDTDRNATALAEMVVLLGRAVEARSRVGGLKPSQWTALRYFHRTQPEARTVGAFARFMMVSHTTASQTTSALVRRNLLTVVEGRDRRVTYLQTTGEGAQLVETADPILEVADALRMLGDDKRQTLTDALVEMVRIVLPAPRG